MTGDAFRDCVEVMASRRECPYTVASLHPTDLSELMNSASFSVGVRMELMGVCLVINRAVPMGTVVFHAPDQPGMLLVAA